jgi:hypothetical protein
MSTVQPAVGQHIVGAYVGPAHPPIELRAVGASRYLLVPGPDLINSHLRKGLPWELNTQVMAELMLTGIAQPVVLDVGANLGAFAVPLGLWLKSRQGRLIAFEPQRPVFYQLCANLFINGLPHCEAHPLAVGAEAAPGVVSLDGMDLPPGHLLKLDVGARALEVLRGATAWLQRSAWPPVLFEGRGGHLPVDAPARHGLLDGLQRLGYTVFMLGQLGVAQHRDNLRFRLALDGDQRLHFTPLQGQTP